MYGGTSITRPNDVPAWLYHAPLHFVGQSVQRPDLGDTKSDMRWSTCCTSGPPARPRTSRSWRTFGVRVCMVPGTCLRVHTYIAPGIYAIYGVCIYIPFFAHGGYMRTRS